MLPPHTPQQVVVQVLVVRAFLSFILQRHQEAVGGPDGGGAWAAAGGLRALWAAVAWAAAGPERGLLLLAIVQVGGAIGVTGQRGNESMQVVEVCTACLCLSAASEQCLHGPKL